MDLLLVLNNVTMTTLIHQMDVLLTVLSRMGMSAQDRNQFVYPYAGITRLSHKRNATRAKFGIFK